MYEYFDLTRYVPVMSVTFLAFTCFFALVVPLMAVYLCRSKLRASFQGLLYGFADYLSLEYMLCDFVWILLLFLPVFKNNSVLYLIVGLILSSILFEVGRYYIIGILQKKNVSFSTVLLFAVTVSGLNSILRILVQAFETFLIAIAINDTGLETLVAEAGEHASDMLQTIEPLLSSPSFLYLMSGFDVFVNLLFHIAITVILYAVFTKRIPNYFLPLTVGIRFLYELPGYLYSYDLLITNPYLAELISIGVTAAVSVTAYRIAMSELQEELASLTAPDIRKGPAKPTTPAQKGSIRNNANILSSKSKGTSEK